MSKKTKQEMIETIGILFEEIKRQIESCEIENFSCTFRDDEVIRAKYVPLGQQSDASTLSDIRISSAIVFDVIRIKD